MDMIIDLDFEAPTLACELPGMPDCTLNQLNYGVIEMDANCIVLRYNRTESNYSGLAPERVIGRHFFRDVAPCSNNRRVAQRYEQSTLDESIDYTFALRMKLTPVKLRMLKRADSATMYLLVRWP